METSAVIAISRSKLVCYTFINQWQQVFSRLAREVEQRHDGGSITSGFIDF